MSFATLRTLAPRTLGDVEPHVGRACPAVAYQSVQRHPRHGRASSLDRFTVAPGASPEESGGIQHDGHVGQRLRGGGADRREPAQGRERTPAAL